MPLDPTFLVPYFVSKVFDEIFTQTKNTYNCRKDCEELHKLLQIIRPLVDPLRSRAVATPQDGLAISAGPNALKNWSEDLGRALKEAQDLVLKCKLAKWYSVFERNSLSRKILKITGQIQKIASVAPFAVLNIAEEVFQTVSANAMLLEEIRTQRLVDVNARIVGATTQATLQIEGIQPAQATLEIRSGTDTFASSVFSRNAGQMGGQPSSLPENGPDDMGASDALRPRLRQVPDKTFGMETSLAKLQELLLNKIENMKWVGVYGTGGIGKSLLAEQAYNSEAVQTHFQNNTFWVTAGKSSSVEKLQRTLCSQMDVRFENYMDSREEVRMKLFNALSGKKVLLVVDDVWEDDGAQVLDWLNVTSGWESGSKILVTTRNIEVLERKSAQDVSTVKMVRLSDEDSWELFCEFTFYGGVEKFPIELEKLGRAVAEECKGLPLALKVIAGAQAGQKSKKQWERTLKKLKDAEALDTNHQEHLYNRLQLSYDSLDSLERDQRHRLKRCFIYFAAFPEDADVDVAKLISLWAGEKLLDDGVRGDDIDDEIDPSIDGNFLLGILVGRSLIELRNAKWSRKANSLKLTCRVHDVLRDLARNLIHRGLVPMGCLFRAGEGQKKFPDEWLTSSRPGCLALRVPKPRDLIRDAIKDRDVTHLSLNNNLLASLPTKVKAHGLEVLLLADANGAGSIRRNSILNLVISPGFLESFSALKVLDLEKTRIDSLPESVENLTNLIYLELSFTRVRDLPRGLRKLTQLEHLGLEGCRDLEPWPFSISCLSSLVTLNTRGSNGVWTPKLGSGRLCSAVCPIPGDSIECLCSLTALRNLSIGGDHEYLPSELSSLVHLRQLILYFSRLKTLPPELCDSSGRPLLSNVQHLDLDNSYALSELPSWVDSLPKLTNLNLVNCRKLMSLPNLHRLHLLQTLDLSFCSGLLNLPDGFASNGAFESLEELYMMNCEGLKEFPPLEDGAFPRLETLNLTGCAFQSLPSSLSRLPELSNLKLNLCRLLESLDSCFISSQGSVLNDPTTQSPRHLPYFPKLRELGLKDVPLGRLPPDLSACPALTKIDLGKSTAVIPDNLRRLQAEGKLSILITSR